MAGAEAQRALVSVVSRVLVLDNKSFSLGGIQCRVCCVVAPAEAWFDLCRMFCAMFI